MLVHVCVCGVCVCVCVRVHAHCGDDCNGVCPTSSPEGASTSDQEGEETGRPRGSKYGTLSSYYCTQNLILLVLHG